MIRTDRRQLLRFALAAVFAVAALAKIVEFDASALQFERLLDLERTGARLLVGLLVLAESALALGLAASTGPGWKRAADVGALALSLTFLFAGLWLWRAGATDCGCFGTWLPMSPQWTVAKNLLLVLTAATLVRRAVPRAVEYR